MKSSAVISTVISIMLLVSPTSKPEPERIALTFDDGPHEKYTEIILDILKEYDIKATFFVIGINAEYKPEIVKREYDEGHEIGNHTYTHKCYGYSCKAYKEEIVKADELIYGITGEYPAIFRPPGGVVGESVKSACVQTGKNIVLWTVDTRDWAHNPAERIVKNVMTNVKNNSIILFHDYIMPPSPTPDALIALLPKLIDKGYEFCTVSELIKPREIYAQGQITIAPFPARRTKFYNG